MIPLDKFIHKDWPKGGEPWGLSAPPKGGEPWGLSAPLLLLGADWTCEILKK